MKKWYILDFVVWIVFSGLLIMTHPSNFTFVTAIAMAFFVGQLKYAIGIMKGIDIASKKK